MMSPDTPPNPHLSSNPPPSNALEGDKFSSPYQSRVRALLGLSGSCAVPLVSAASLPMVELPYVTAQAGVAQADAARKAPVLWGRRQRVESELDVLINNRSEANNPEPRLETQPLETQPLEAPPLEESYQQLTLHEPNEIQVTAGRDNLIDRNSEVRPSNVIQQEGSGSRVELPTSETNRRRNSLAAMPPVSENSYLENPLSDRPAKDEIERQTTNAQLSSANLEEGSGAVTHRLDPETNRTQKSVETRSANAEDSLSELKSIPQTTSIRIPGVTPPRSSNSFLSSPLSSSPLPSSTSPDSSWVENEKLERQALPASLIEDQQVTLPSRQTAVSSLESPSTTLASSSMAAPQISVIRPVTPDSTVPEHLDAATTRAGRLSDLNLAISSASVHSSSANASVSSAGTSSSPANNRNPEDESTFSMPSVQSAFVRKPVAQKTIAPVVMPLAEMLPEREFARDSAETTQRMAAQIEKLERTVADLSAQVDRQKEFQQSVPVVVPQTAQPQVVVQKAAAQSETPRAFWERRYASRLYRWSR